jgi:hypothetical protein
MATARPAALSPARRRARHGRAARLARELGFTGRVEYRHVYSQTGGAQYCRGGTVEQDLLTIYAEAFERDADPDDFSLEAIVAHERGHQLLARHAGLAKRVEGVSIATEEILASLLGAMLCFNDSDRDSLMAKATVELINHCEAADIAIRRLQELWNLLETFL